MGLKLPLRISFTPFTQHANSDACTRMTALLEVHILISGNFAGVNVLNITQYIYKIGGAAATPPSATYEKMVKTCQFRDFLTLL